jgi:hypothetical protein
MIHEDLGNMQFVLASEDKEEASRFKIKAAFAPADHFRLRLRLAYREAAVPNVLSILAYTKR